MNSQNKSIFTCNKYEKQLIVRTYTFRLKTAGIQEIELPDCLKTSLQIILQIIFNNFDSFKIETIIV